MSKKDNPEKMATYDKQDGEKTKQKHNIWWTPLCTIIHK